MPQVSLVAVRPVESHVYSFKHFLYQTFVFPNIRTDWWLWSYALHDFTSRWSSLKVGLQQSSWKVSQKLMKRVKHVVALRASLAMWENSELARLNHSVRSVASGPSKLHTTMFPQHALRMTSCHAGSLQCWFEAPNKGETHLRFVSGHARTLRSDCSKQRGNDVLISALSFQRTKNTF